MARPAVSVSSISCRCKLRLSANFYTTPSRLTYDELYKPLVSPTRGGLNHDAQRLYYLNIPGLS